MMPLPDQTLTGKRPGQAECSTPAARLRTNFFWNSVNQPRKVEPLAAGGIFGDATSDCVGARRLSLLVRINVQPIGMARGLFGFAPFCKHQRRDAF